jgi:hypothetical protein
VNSTQLNTRFKLLYPNPSRRMTTAIRDYMRRTGAAITLVQGNLETPLPTKGGSR